MLARTLLSIAGLARDAHRLCLDARGGGRLGLRPLTFLQVKAAPDSFKGQSAVFGGKVLTARRQKDSTRIEILQLPLDQSTRPGYDLTQSQGRFIALQREFLDPATLPPGTRITVTGEVSGSITLPLDETDYTYPVIDIKRRASLGQIGRRGSPYPPLYGARSLLGALLEPLLAALALLVRASPWPPVPGATTGARSRRMLKKAVQQGRIE